MSEHVCFDNTGKYAVSGCGGYNKTVKIWAINTGKAIRTFEGHSQNGTPIAFSPDSRYVLAPVNNCIIKLREVSTGNEVKAFTGHTREVRSVAFSPDGKYAQEKTFNRLQTPINEIGVNFPFVKVQ